MTIKKLVEAEEKVAEKKVTRTRKAATTTVETTLQVGDKVQVIVKEPIHKWGAVRPGDVGVITQIMPDGNVTIDFPADSGWHGLISEIAPATETAKKAIPQTCWTLYNDLTLQQARKRIPYVLLYGPPGTGKTTQARDFAKGRPIFNVTVTEDMTDSQLLGHFVPEGNVFRWHDGPAIRAWKEGGLLIINEINRAGGSVLTALYAICDDHGIAQLTLLSGEKVAPHKDFFCVATMNDPPEVLPEALRDRFPVSLKIDTPHPGALKSLPTDVRQAVVASYQNKSLPVTFRQAKAYQELVDNGMTKEGAVQVVFGVKAADLLMALKLGTRK